MVPQPVLRSFVRFALGPARSPRFVPALAFPFPTRPARTRTRFAHPSARFPRVCPPRPRARRAFTHARIPTQFPQFVVPSFGSPVPRSARRSATPPPRCRLALPRPAHAPCRAHLYARAFTRHPARLCLALPRPLCLYLTPPLPLPLPFAFTTRPCPAPLPQPSSHPSPFVTFGFCLRSHTPVYLAFTFAHGCGLRLLLCGLLLVARAALCTHTRTFAGWHSRARLYFCTRAFALRTLHTLPRTRTYTLFDVAARGRWRARFWFIVRAHYAFTAHRALPRRAHFTLRTPRARLRPRVCHPLYRFALHFALPHPTLLPACPTHLLYTTTRSCLCPRYPFTFTHTLYLCICQPPHPPTTPATGWLHAAHAAFARILPACHAYPTALPHAHAPAALPRRCPTFGSVAAACRRSPCPHLPYLPPVAGSFLPHHALPFARALRPHTHLLPLLLHGCCTAHARTRCLCTVTRARARARCAHGFPHAFTHRALLPGRVHHPRYLRRVPRAAARFARFTRAFCAHVACRALCRAGLCAYAHAAAHTRAQVCLCPPRYRRHARAFATRRFPRTPRAPHTARALRTTGFLLPRLPLRYAFAAPPRATPAVLTRRLYLYPRLALPCCLPCSSFAAHRALRSLRAPAHAFSMVLLYFLCYFALPFAILPFAGSAAGWMVHHHHRSFSFCAFAGSGSLRAAGSRCPVVAAVPVDCVVALLLRVVAALPR